MDLFSGDEIVSTFRDLGVTHVVWLPDSALGRWETALMASESPRLIRVCREGEAWALAAGLILGGKRPIVVMQSTGLYDSGDALRNVVHDLKLPVFGLIGLRSWLAPGSTDSARRFALPIVQAWDIPYTMIESPAEKPNLRWLFERCQAAGTAGLVLLAEGKR